MKSRIAILCLAGLLAGCSPSETSLVGQYRGEAISTESDNSIAKNLGKGLASTVSLELKADKTFHLVAMIVPVDGKWSLEGDRVILTPDKVFGLQKGDGVNFSSNKPMEFRANGKGLEPANSDSRFRFVKENG